jgi:ubiquinone biosynthesis protein
MKSLSPISRLTERARAAGFDATLTAFLHPSLSTSKRIQMMQSALNGPAGAAVRDVLGQWIAETLRVLVPASSARWRVLVHDAMLFIVMHLSDARLAPKLVAQLELPQRATAERRLMLLITKVPGLQKLGQVLGRNRALEPRLRTALTRLENGIRDMKVADVRATVSSQLSAELKTYSVVLRPSLLSEATVSAVLPFTWKNPASGRREHGVFKVLKPHIPQYYAEDMDMLQGLAEFLKRNHRKYGVGARGLADTFTEVRRLLQHEVDFRGEQQRLEAAHTTYGSIKGVRVPTVIPQLCTSIITAMTEECGVKITLAARRMNPSRRRELAEQTVRALIATPLFATTDAATFHADPHAGNLLYDSRTGEIVLLDWALTGTLTLEQRRHLTLLFLMVLLRDSQAVFDEVMALSLEQRISASKRSAIRETVDRFIADLPLWRAPDSMDAMGLLQRLAFDVVRLPASLILMRKVMFTLEAVVEDIVGKELAMDKVLVRSLFWRWLTRKLPVGSPLETADWLRLQTSTLLSPSRWLVNAAHAAINRPAKSVEN